MSDLPTGNKQIIENGVFIFKYLCYYRSIQILAYAYFTKKFIYDTF